MSKYQVSRRLQFVIQYIHDSKYASKEAILDFLAEKDFEISSRTLERDFELIKSDFGIELAYSKQYNGYYIDTDRSVKVESFFRFLELVTIANVFADGLKDSSKLLDYVEFDDSSHLKGINNLEMILLSIKQGRDLHFTHYNFHRDSYREKKVAPILLKEYINRWYLVGVPDGASEIRTFGIERMSDLKLGKLSKLDKAKYIKQVSRFKDIIGLNFNARKPETIVLKVTEGHLKYLETLPLHPSQKIMPCNEDGYGLVSYDLIPNYEFDIELLKMSIEVEVISPKRYRDYFKQQVQDIYKKYQD